jgi:alkylation response protein AidB-like acyl-CoA dehydrogenase
LNLSALPDGFADRLWPPHADAAIVRAAREYVVSAVAPEAERIDRDDIYPVEIMKGLGRTGYTTVTLGREYGGQGRPYADAVAVCEELGVASPAVAVSLITIFQAQTMIRLFASETLQKRYLPAFAKGLLTSYALTEANHGSDIRRLDTKARLEEGEWILSGEKHFITSGSGAELFVILAETEQGVSAFAVPRETPGIEVYEGSNSATFGLRNGPHMNMRLADVRLPGDHMIGIEGKGVRQAVTVLDYSRTLAAAISLGIARAAFEQALIYARDRVAFDQRVLEFQGIQWYFAEMLADIDGARLLVYRAASALENHDEIARWSSEAKLRASAVATAVASRAVQVCGAYGVRVDAPFGRYLRDAKAYEIGGGSSEVLKNTIAKFLLSGAGLQRKP